MPAVRRSYTFKEGLTMMAAKAVGVDPELAAEAGENAHAAINAIRNALKTKDTKARSAHIRDAQHEISLLSPSRHGALINALNAKLLALQGRGEDTEVAHVALGEVVVPRELLTPELVELIAIEAVNRGIDPRRLMVGGQGSINPETGAEEFGLFDTIKGWFGGAQSDQLDMTGIDKPLSVTRRSEVMIDPIAVSATRHQNSLLWPRNPFGLRDPTEEEKAAHQYPAEWQDVYRSYPDHELREKQGGFWDIRKGGTSTQPDQFRYHQAIDQLASPGTQALASITGKVTKIGRVSDKNPLTYITIESMEKNGPVARQLYLRPTVRKNDNVVGGKTVIGIQQDTAPYYGKTPVHQHTEFYDPMRTRGGQTLKERPQVFDYNSAFPLDAKSRMIRR